MNSQSPEAVQTVHGKKIGSIQQKNCDSHEERFRKKIGEKQMKPSTKDQIQGKLHELKGKAKETAGQVTNRPNLEAEGQAEQLAGKVQKKIGQIAQVFEK
jgi:uncharacterized protein YjbJ (UPF0337 family)